ncbi:outer membrane protein assembly factor BamE [Minwuia thermotolerans]|uniref:Outer membrane protein assembly factor BamE n=2 Tax=Minwuia thermotolerans TaxID=2056226 RepID=A0A2M9G1M3_9PROT|nr:outer membrane protein assembly factor BamE [Minwuia thermotolerans]
MVAIPRILERRQMNRAILTVCAAAALVLAIAACTPDRITRGHHLDQQDIDRVQVGVTTQQQVTDILGSPSSVATFQQHSDTWYYISKQSERYTELDEETVAQQVVAIDFDETGRVANLRQYDMGDAQQVAYVKRETPTQGAKLGFFEQLLGNLIPGQQ